MAIVYTKSRLVATSRMYSARLQPWKNGFVTLAKITDVIYDSCMIALMATFNVNNLGTVNCYANLLTQSWLLILFRPRKSAKIKE